MSLAIATDPAMPKLPRAGLAGLGPALPALAFLFICLVLPLSSLLLLSVTRIIEPSLSDPSVLAGIDAQLLDQQLEPLLARHVRWILNGIG